MSHFAEDSVVNALSFDVEDWYHGLCASPEEWPCYADRLATGMDRVLGTLEEHSCKATFFVLAPLAKAHPKIIRQIVDLGHEIGSHGCSHIPLYRQTPGQLRQDIEQSVQLLEDKLGQPISGYRAPFFSVTSRTLWALDIIAEAGLSYDSSIFPVHNPRYGIPAARRFPHQLPNGLVEFPVSTLQVGGLNLPFSGGVYARLLGVHGVQWGIRQLNRRQQPALVYFHPWEFDPKHPRKLFKGLAGLYHLTHYHNLRSTAHILSALLETFRFESVSSALRCANEKFSIDVDKHNYTTEKVLK